VERGREKGGRSRILTESRGVLENSGIEGEQGGGARVVLTPANVNKDSDRRLEGTEER